MPGVCHRCRRNVYVGDEKVALGKVWHSFCISCKRCRKLLDEKSAIIHEGDIYCYKCFKQSSESETDDYDDDDDRCCRRRSVCCRYCRSPLPDPPQFRACPSAITSWYSRRHDTEPCPDCARCSTVKNQVGSDFRKEPPPKKTSSRGCCACRPRGAERGSISTGLPYDADSARINKTTSRRDCPRYQHESELPYDAADSAPIKKAHSHGCCPRCPRGTQTTEPPYDAADSAPYACCPRCPRGTQTGNITTEPPYDVSEADSSPLKKRPTHSYSQRYPRGTQTGNTITELPYDVSEPDSSPIRRSTTRGYSSLSPRGTQTGNTITELPDDVSEPESSPIKRTTTRGYSSRSPRGTQTGNTITELPDDVSEPDSSPIRRSTARGYSLRSPRGTQTGKTITELPYDVSEPDSSPIRRSTTRGYSSRSPRGTQTGNIITELPDDAEVSVPSRPHISEVKESWMDSKQLADPATTIIEDDGLQLTVSFSHTGNQFPFEEILNDAPRRSQRVHSEKSLCPCCSNSSFHGRNSDKSSQVPTSSKNSYHHSSVRSGGKVKEEHKPYEQKPRKHRRCNSCSRDVIEFVAGSPCRRCGLQVYHAEMILAAGTVFHTSCFTCLHCHKPLEPMTLYEGHGEIFCKQCYVKRYGPVGYGYGKGAGTLQMP